jgi:hypothetical protein
MTFAYKLGRQPVKPHAKTLRFSKYVVEALPPAPRTRAWENKIGPNGWQMFGNDNYGDCTCAGLAHLLMAWSSQVGNLITLTTEQVLDLYSAVTGFNQKTGANDNGAAMTEVLSHVQKNGLFGRKILGWAALDIKNVDHFRIGLNEFGGTYTGVNLPASAMQQFNAGGTWEVVANDGGIEGGHCVPYLGFGSLGEAIVTWGKVVHDSVAWRAKYLEEAYVIIGEDWFDAQGNAPSQIDQNALYADLKLIAA